MSNEIEVAKSTALSDIDAELQRRAAAIAQNVRTGGSAISLRDKKFNLPNGEIVDGELDLVVLDYRYWNKYYTKPWNPKTPEAPVCYACNEDERSLEPFDTAPEKQADDCASCPMNVFGSKGDAKACRNTMTLAVMLPGGDEVLTLSVSPTAKKDIAGALVKSMQVFGHPVKATMTFALVDAARGFKLKVTNMEPNEDYKHYAQFLKQAEDAVTAEPVANGVEEEVAAKPAAKPAAAPRRRSRAA